MTRMRWTALLTLVFCTFILTACDNDGQSADAAPSAQTAPSAGGDTLPLPAADTPGESVEDDSSMAEESPAGEGVTAEEIPHSDVPPPSRDVFTDAACDFETWVGQPVNEAAVKDTGRPYRLLTPDSMMTMDYNPERVNVVHDGQGKVTRVWCG